MQPNAPMHIPTPQLLRAADVAEQLGESLDTVRRAIRRGDVNPAHLDEHPGATVNVSQAALDRLDVPDSTRERAAGPSPEVALRPGRAAGVHPAPPLGHPFTTQGAPTMTISMLRRRQAAWVRVALTAPASDGQQVDEADIKQLPPAFRAEARAVCQEAIELHRAGSRQAARELARTELGTLAADLPDDWQPPRTEGPDPHVLDLIQGRV
jgi:hypothetical protein